MSERLVFYYHFHEPHLCVYDVLLLLITFISNMVSDIVKITPVGGPPLTFQSGQFVSFGMLIFQILCGMNFMEIECRKTCIKINEYDTRYLHVTMKLVFLLLYSINDVLIQHAVSLSGPNFSFSLKCLTTNVNVGNLYPCDRVFLVCM